MSREGVAQKHLRPLEFVENRGDYLNRLEQFRRLHVFEMESSTKLSGAIRQICNQFEVHLDTRIKHAATEYSDAVGVDVMGPANQGKLLGIGGHTGHLGLVAVQWDSVKNFTLGALFSDPSSPLTVVRAAPFPIKVTTAYITNPKFASFEGCYILRLRKYFLSHQLSFMDNQLIVY